MEFKVFFVYSCVIALGIALTVLLFYTLHYDQAYLTLLRVVLILEFSLISIYYALMLKTRISNLLILTANLLFWGLCFYVFTKIPVQKFPVYLRYLLAIECLFFIVVIVYDFFKKMQYCLNEPIYYNSSFWISVAFLIYFSGNVLLFIYLGSLGLDPIFIQYYSIIYSFFSILKDLLFAIAVLVHVFTKKETRKTNSIAVDLDLGFINNPSRNPLIHQP